jgi:hypothetical protein
MKNEIEEIREKVKRFQKNTLDFTKTEISFLGGDILRYPMVI